MTNLRLTLLAVSVLGMTTPASAQTATNYPFCIQGVDNPGWSGCSFSSFQQCEASASGTESECLSNPWYKPNGNEAPASDGFQPVQAPPD